MKFLLVLVAAVGVSQAAVTCDECQAAAQDFVSHLLSEESLAEQTQILKDNVCPQVTLSTERTYFSSTKTFIAFPPPFALKPHLY